MPEAFVPFFSAQSRGPSSDFQPSAAPATGGPTLTEPLPPGSSPSLPAEKPHLHSPASAYAQPEISVQKNGDQIVRITIKCVCGQIIELDCQ